MNVQHTLLIFASIAASGSAFAQQQQDIDKFRLAGSGKVTLTQGTPFSITLEGTPITSGQYHTFSGDGWVILNPSGNDELRVTSPRIRQVDVAGSGKLESEGMLETGDLELRVSGSGKIELQINAQKVHVVISGSGKVELKGTATDLKVDISGSGKVDGEELKVPNCLANISGSGRCLVDVTDSLTSNISGSGAVYFVQPPAHISNNISGTGRVGDVDAVENDTTRVMLGKKKILIIDDEGKDIRLMFKDTILIHKREVLHSHWAGFEMGVNMLMNEDFKNDPPAGYNFLEQRPEKSIAINFNLVDYEVKLYHRNIMLVTGFGFTINNYRFTSDEYLAPGTDSVTAIPGGSLKKNKLVAQYLTVPLLIEFNTSENPNRTFHVATGVIGGVRLASHVKIISSANGEEVKKKAYDDFNLNPLRCDLTLRMGVGKFTAFANYDLVNFFKDSKIPELHPLTVGIRFIGWSVL